MFERRYRENVGLDLIISKEIQETPRAHREVITVAEWRGAYEQLRTFSYSNSKARIQDLAIISNIGFYTLSTANLWGECQELADWLLQVGQIEQVQDWLPKIYYWKAMALLHILDEDHAFRYYLESTRRLFLLQKEHQYSYLLGIDLLEAVEPKKRADEEHIVVPGNVIEFARELFSMRYPSKKMPASLESRKEGTVSTWDGIYKDLIQYLSR